MDFDLHGLVRLRCVDATPDDLAIVARQLGLPQTEATCEPEIRIRFVDRFEADRLRSFGEDDVAFGDDAFFVLRGPRRSRVMVQIPFDQIGGPCELVCERGLAQVPLLPEVMHLTALARGVLPLHASAFRHEGRGVLVTGGPGGGKTATLLAFMSRGAEYVGDDRVFVAEGGGRIFGTPERICVRDWHLDQLPGYRARLGLWRRLGLGLARAAAEGVDRAIEGRRVRRRPPSRILDRLLPTLRGRLDVEWPARELFGPPALALSGPLDRIFVVTRHAAPEVTVAPMPEAEAVERIGVLLEHERAELMACYRKYRFAFPGRRNALLDGAEALEGALLAKALEGVAVYALRHPKPVALGALFEAVRARL